MNNYMKRKIVYPDHSLLCIIVLLLLPICSWSQTKYAESITKDDILAIVNVLASDSLRGREAGTADGLKASNYLAEQYSSFDLLKGNKDSYFQKIPLRHNDSTYNVIGMIKGSEYPDEYVVITAHYDHIGVRRGQIYKGADDNASGTAALLEVGQAFMEADKNGDGPKRSILILAWGAEEKGLLGSAYYADNDPIFPLTTVVANLNMDMIGHLDELHPEDPNFVSIVGSDWQSSELHQIHEAANEKYVGLSLDYTYNSKDHPERFFYRSDQYNFAKYGIPVIFYTSGDHEDYHKPTDTIANLKIGRIQKVAQLVFYTAWELANRDKRISVDKPLE